MEYIKWFGQMHQPTAESITALQRVRLWMDRKAAHSSRGGRSPTKANELFFCPSRAVCATQQSSDALYAVCAVTIR